MNASDSYMRWFNEMMHKKRYNFSCTYVYKMETNKNVLNTQSIHELSIN